MPTKHNTRKSTQKGGRVAMPIQYFDPTSTLTNYYPAESPELTQFGNNAYGAHYPVSYGMPGPNDGLVGPNLAAYEISSPHSSPLQTGGGNPYEMIVNPETGRRVSVNGKIGRRVLRNYLYTSSQ